MGTTCARAAAIALGLAVLAAGAHAQCWITTTLAGTSGQKGNMFDVVAARAILIGGFDQNLPPGTHTIEIYTRSGTFLGSQFLSGNWTLVGSASNVVSPGFGIATPIPVAVNVTVQAGATQAFYITSTTSLNLGYSNGTAVGGVYVQNADLAIHEGIGNTYPFGSTYSPRVWNGRIRYTTSFPEYQMNQPGAGLTIDGAQGDFCTKASVSRSICSAIGGTTVFNAIVTGATPGVPYDFFFTAGPAIPTSAGAYITAGLQIVNLDLSDPTFLALFGLTGAYAFANTTIPFNVNFAIDTTVQLAVMDGLNPDGFRVSQVNELHVTDNPVPPPVAGPAGDDSFATYAFAGLPCGPASFPFFGVNRTSFSVVSNGRVMFGTPDVGFSPTAALAMSQSPSIDAWVDLNPDPVTGGGGNVAVTIPALGIVRVQWTNVPYYGVAGSANTFAIVMDSNTGTILIDNIPTFLPIPAPTPNMFLGLSPGSPSATNAGATTFLIGGPHPAISPAGMIYEFGPTGTLGGGALGLAFTPAGNTYAWAGY